MADGVIYNHFPGIAKNFQTAIKKVVGATATKIKVRASIAAPRDTGFLGDSIYTVINGKSTYGTRLRTTAKGGRRKVKIGRDDLLPEIPPPPDAFTAYAVVGAYYGQYVNYGTRFMAAQPFWEPAIDATQPDFLAALAAIESMIGQGVMTADASMIVTDSGF